MTAATVTLSALTMKNVEVGAGYLEALEGSNSLERSCFTEARGFKKNFCRFQYASIVYVKNVQFFFHN